MKTRTLTRLVTTVLMTLVVAGAALVAQVAPAGALTVTAEAHVEYGNADCGDTVLGAPVIGSARFVRSGDRMAVRYVMTAGDAATDYEVWLFDADTCGPLRRLGSFTSDAAGGGSVTSKQVGVAGSSRFYAVARDVSTFPGLLHGSLAVELP